MFMFLLVKLIQELLLNSKPIKLTAIRKSSIECKFVQAFELILNFLFHFSTVEDEPIYAHVPEVTAMRGRSQSIISLGSMSSVIMATTRRGRPQTYQSWSIDRKLVIKIHSTQRIFFK